MGAGLDGTTCKEFGDGCEMLVAAELTLAGVPAHQIPSCWPGYDLVAKTAAGLTRVSVKGLRAGNGKQAAFWRFDVDGWDWLALIRIDVVDGRRDIFVVPREAALALSRPTADGTRRMYYTEPGLEVYRNNFALAEALPHGGTAAA
jgi:hypothetical protein